MFYASHLHQVFNKYLEYISRTAKYAKENVFVFAQFKQDQEKDRIAGRSG